MKKNSKHHYETTARALSMLIQDQAQPEFVCLLIALHELTEDLGDSITIKHVTTLAEQIAKDYEDTDMDN